MKKVLIGLLILISATIYAQDIKDHRNQQQGNKTAPTNVQNSFQKDYPNAQNAQWNNSNGQWHATYKDENNRNVQTHYNRNGQRIDTHIPYKQEELPSGIRNEANKKYHSNYNAYRIERPNAKPFFQINTQNGHTEYRDENGKKIAYQDNH